MPSEGCINDYYYVFKQKGLWKLWSDLVKRQEPDVNQYGVQVVTVDSARYSYLVEMHIKVSNTKNTKKAIFSSVQLFVAWKTRNARRAASYWQNIYTTACT